jgi:sec-independent protein translocase protein TatA
MFDPSAPHIIILVVVVLLLFGSRRLPGAARSLGQSMHIFKKSVQGMDEDNDSKDVPAQGATMTLSQPALSQPAQPQLTGQPQTFAAAPQTPTREQQLADLQRQISDLQKQDANSDS